MQTQFYLVKTKEKPMVGKELDIESAEAEQFELAGENEEGELFIGGSGVSFGYFDLPELTAKVFNQLNVYLR